MHSLFNLLPFPSTSFVSQTAAFHCLHTIQSSPLWIFTLITFTVLLSISQSICQTLMLNQHKSMSPLFKQPLAISVIFPLIISLLGLCALLTVHLGPDASLLSDSYDNLWAAVWSLLLNRSVLHFYHFTACKGDFLPTTKSSARAFSSSNNSATHFRVPHQSVAGMLFLPQAVLPFTT